MIDWLLSNEEREREIPTKYRKNCHILSRFLLVKMSSAKIATMNGMESGKATAVGGFNGTSNGNHEKPQGATGELFAVNGKPLDFSFKNVCDLTGKEGGGES